MTNRITKLYDDHLEKDNRLWSELGSTLDALQKMGEFTESDLKKAGVLTALIHDNNYMLVTLAHKIADIDRRGRNKDGNH